METPAEFGNLLPDFVTWLDGYWPGWHSEYSGTIISMQDAWVAGRAQLLESAMKVEFKP